MERDSRQGEGKRGIRSVEDEWVVGTSRWERKVPSGGSAVVAEMALVEVVVMVVKRWCFLSWLVMVH